jgi:hypothetical protein
MTVSIDVPPRIEEMLRQAFGEHLDRAALEAMALEGYRAGRLSRFQVQNILGFENRWDTEEWLGERGATLHYSLADLEEDRRTLDRVLGPAKP